MVYYIDVQPVRKKSRFSLRQLRIWVYPAALIISVILALFLTKQHESTVITASVSASEVSISEYDISESVSQVSVSVPLSFASPLDSAYISSHYGYRTNPISGDYRLHGGLDLACGEGSSIYAVLGGKVTASAYSDSYGYYIIIDHPDGMQTLYAHCSKLLKTEGDEVSQGEVVALVGSTGNSTGPHLHIELRIDGERTDPEQYFGGYFQ